MDKGGKLYCEIARKAARRLGSPGQLDFRAEDQDDYHSELWLRGCRADEKARVCQKPERHARLSASLAIWNGARTIQRDRSRALNRVPISGVDPDRLPVSVDLDSRIDACRLVQALRVYLSPEDWVLVEALAEAEGGVLRACRALGWEGSKSEFVRAVLALRARAGAIVARVVA